MNTTEKRYACTSPYLLWACILSCTICTLVMIWGVILMAQMNTSMATASVDHSMMDMSDPMSMSMADMGKMLEGKTGDALDTAFLEGMIPHHQGAIDMAQYLEKSERPELQQLGKDIIEAQTKEIAQMQNWLKEWNLGSKTSTTSNTMDSMMMPPDAGTDSMKEHCQMMPEMVGCEVYK